MMQTDRVTNKAAGDTQGMTLAELTTFVQDAWKADLDPETTRIRVRSTVLGLVRQISAEAPK